MNSKLVSAQWIQLNRENESLLIDERKKISNFSFLTATVHISSTSSHWFLENTEMIHAMMIQ